MMKIKSIANMENFFHTVEQCQGSVLLHLPDQTVCDLKQNLLASHLLRMGNAGQKELTLSLTNGKDFPLFLTYMMEAACV